MDINPIETFYQNLQEPHKSCLLFIRQLILKHNEHFTEHWKWGGPFFYFKKKMLCYFWFNKKLNKPYISFGEGKYIQHPELQKDGRVRFKLYYVNTDEDVDVETIIYLLDQSINSMEQRGIV